MRAAVDTMDDVGDHSPYVEAVAFGYGDGRISGIGGPQGDAVVVELDELDGELSVNDADSHVAVVYF